MTRAEFFRWAAKSCIAEQMATIQHEDLRRHWELIVLKYLYAVDEQKEPLPDPTRLGTHTK